jgi:hypothetical protein
VYADRQVLPQIFEALAAADGYSAGLQRLGEGFKCAGAPRLKRFYYEEIMGRSPETASKAREIVDSPYDCIREMLCSNEFMASHEVLFQRAFPNLIREFFLHVPKSGGTTVLQAFQSDDRFCPLHIFPGFDNGWFGDRLGYLRNVILRLQHPNTQYVFMYGHPSASRVIDGGLKRGWDNVFTVLRDPIDACLSWVNYVLTQFCENPDHADVVLWRQRVEMSDQSSLLDRATAVELVPKILERIVPDNPASNLLGIEPHLGSVIETAAILGLKMIRFEQIDDYIRFRGIAQFNRMNVSKRFIEFSELDQRVRLMMYDKSAEDIKLYDWFTRHALPGVGPWLEL